MASDSPSRPGRAAAAGAALGAVSAVLLSAPALTRPFLPGLAFCVLLPASLGGLLGASLGLLPLGRGSWAAALGASLGAAPWLAVAAAPIARLPWAAALGALLAVGVASFAALPTRRLPRAVFPILPLLLFLIPRQGTIPLPGERPVVVLGFDAATWEVIDPWIRSRDLPAFAELRQDGATGVFRSEEPSASPRVWTTIATGVSPEKHRILSFASRRPELAAGRIWNEALAHGKRAGVVGWLVNWPPEAGLSFSTPAWPDGGDLSRPAAADFVKRMDMLHKSGVPLLSVQMLPLGLSAIAVSTADDAWRMLDDARVLVAAGDDETLVDSRLRLLRARLKTDLFLELLDRERPDFGALVTYPTDQFGHKYWLTHQPELFPSQSPEELRAHGDLILAAYAQADRTLGKVRARLDLERTTLFVVSDHGMEGLPESEGGGRLVKVSAEKLLPPLGLDQGLRSDYLNERLILTPATGGEAGTVALQRAAKVLGAIHFADREGGPWIVEEDDGRGYVAVRPVHRGRIPEGEIEFAGKRIPASALFFTDLESGRHTLHGICAVLGPGVLPGARIQDAGLRDLAPSALYALGLALPEALEGKPFQPCWSPEVLAARPPRSRPGALAPAPKVQGQSTDEDYTRRALQELGYAE